MIPDLSAFPRVPLGTWPTPLQEAPRLSEAMGGRILLKRDDVNGLGAGGNKLRKLEYLLGGALADGADTVITFGSLQTNYGRQTAAAAAHLGLRCELVLTTSVPRSGEAYEQSGNLVLGRLFGAGMHICRNGAEAQERAQALVEAERVQGRRAVVLPMGGSNALGTLGYVSAAQELADQLRQHGIEQARIVAPLGSSGTAAGLILGAAGLPWDLSFACVLQPAGPAETELWKLVEETATLLGVKPPPSDRVHINDRALGPGYGQPTREVWHAVRTFARTEGVLLDPVYTGKSAAHLLAGTGVDTDVPTVFLHTGGLPALFAYLPEMAEALE
ncbi:D-cysteine desulfhydrase family protein [Streptomyces sp. TRM49041]|uniref:D-cysteine desulfhydrase family protein n=1 Tax=Streptomyces sp. TRM49041 TaxID=2603216 RepID=UPI0011EF4B3D|nr:D-cysteine desulfhydrase family protein [Streptomyces sp. TRM49041]